MFFCISWYFWCHGIFSVIIFLILCWLPLLSGGGEWMKGVNNIWLSLVLKLWADINAATEIVLWYTFSLRLTVFLPPLSKVQFPNFLDIRNLWGKEMKRSGLRFEHLFSKMVYNLKIFEYLSVDGSTSTCISYIFQKDGQEISTNCFTIWFPKHPNVHLLSIYFYYMS